MVYAYSSMMIMGLYNKHLTKQTYLIFRNSIPFNWNMEKQLILLLLLTIVESKVNKCPCNHFVKMETLLPPEHIATIIDNESSCLFRIINFTDFLFHFFKFNDTLCTHLYMDQIFGIESVLPSVFTNDRCRNSSTTYSVSSIHVDNITHTYMYDG